MVYRQLLEALKKEGVEAIEAVGKQFDPTLAPSCYASRRRNMNQTWLLKNSKKAIN